MYDEERGRRGDSAEDNSGGHRGEENPEKSKGESEERRTMDRSMIYTEKQEVEREVGRRMHGLKCTRTNQRCMQ